MAKKETSKVKTDILNEALKIMEKGELVELRLRTGRPENTAEKSRRGQDHYHKRPAIHSRCAAAAAPAEAKKPADDPKTGIIKSPMVGTFYKASSPDSPPFVKIGDMIEPGKTVCIIEAMKIMNEIKSEIKGRVKEIVVENAQAVEFNQPLIIVEKN